MAHLTHRASDTGTVAGRFRLAKTVRMNPIILWNWLKKNTSLSLLLVATVDFTLALGRLVHGTTWSLFMPTALAAALGGWWAGKSRLSGRRAAGWLVAPGISGLFLYITGLGVALGNLLCSIIPAITQSVLQVYHSAPVDMLPIVAAWTTFSAQAGTILSRLGAWIWALSTKETTTDPIATTLAWSILLWLVGSWSGWHLRRHHQALRALAPGGVVLALVLDYTGREIGLVVLYLACMLVLIGLSHYWRSRAIWERRGVDYSESIAIDSTVAILSITIFLTGLAALTPSLSWQDLVERVRRGDRGDEGHVAETLGLEAPPNVAGSAAYRPNGLPRQQLLGMPPELLEELVLTVATGEIPPLPNVIKTVSVNRYYWRSVTYDRYTSVGWASSPAENHLLAANIPLMESVPEYRVIRQNVNLVSAQNERLYWTGTLVLADNELEIAWRSTPPPEPSPAGEGDMLGALAASNTYTVVSIIPQVSAAQLRAAGNNYPSEVARRYLRLPETVPERVLAKARELTTMAPTPYDRALAIESYLRTFPYTLEVEPAPPGRDIVDYFLFTAQKGYCDYYASAMVVLARAAGLPARIVIGYVSGTYNWSTAQYEVRQKDAHSWPEIYFPGIGWVEFEPTAGLPEITRVEDQNNPQTGYNPAPKEIFDAWIEELWQMLISSLAGKAILGLAGLAALIAVGQAGEVWVLTLAPDAKAIQRLYTRLQSKSQRLLPNLLRGHTPQALQAALVDRLVRQKDRLKALLRPAAGEIASIVRLYEMQVYSQGQPDRSQVIQGIKAWARLRWRLRMAGWRVTRNTTPPQVDEPDCGHSQ
jgi:transglutaminase-like putative cysteine protease